MPIQTRNQTILQGYPLREETLTASAAIKPGHLVEINTGQLRPHATSAGFAVKMFAVERSEAGRGLTSDYAANEIVHTARCEPGDHVYALAPSGQNLAIGAFLESNGDGSLKAGTTNPIAQSLDATGAITALTRIRVVII